VSPSLDRFRRRALRSSLARVAAVGGFAVAVAACGGDDETATTDATAASVVTVPETTAAPVTETTAATGADRGAGRSLLPTQFEPASLVTLDPLLYQAALLLGVEPIGSSTFQTNDGEGGPLPAYLPADVLARAELFGTILDPNLELVAAADADLVLGSTVFAPNVAD
jgi:ABC-type Fe3+-hydroxamate transport system substrate-binding protein